jgi:hypothetical protein
LPMAAAGGRLHRWTRPTPRAAGHSLRERASAAPRLARRCSGRQPRRASRRSRRWSRTARRWWPASGALRPCTPTARSRAASSPRPRRPSSRAGRQMAPAPKARWIQTRWRRPLPGAATRAKSFHRAGGSRAPAPCSRVKLLYCRVYFSSKVQPPLCRFTPTLTRRARGALAGHVQRDARGERA